MRYMKVQPGRTNTEQAQAGGNAGLMGEDLWVGFSNSVRSRWARFFPKVVDCNRTRINNFLSLMGNPIRKKMGGLHSENNYCKTKERADVIWNKGSNLKNRLNWYKVSLPERREGQSRGRKHFLSVWDRNQWYPKDWTFFKNLWRRVSWEAHAEQKHQCSFCSGFCQGEPPVGTNREGGKIFIGRQISQVSATPQQGYCGMLPKMSTHKRQRCLHSRRHWNPKEMDIKRFRLF